VTCVQSSGKRLPWRKVEGNFAPERSFIEKLNSVFYFAMPKIYEASAARNRTLEEGNAVTALSE